MLDVGNDLCDVLLGSLELLVERAHDVLHAAEAVDAEARARALLARQALHHLRHVYSPSHAQRITSANMTLLTRIAIVLFAMKE